MAITKRSKWREPGVLSSGNYALAISMAQLWREQDKRQQARDLLAPPIAGSPNASTYSTRRKRSLFAQRANVK
jgi:hypothetical protein